MTSTQGPSGFSRRSRPEPVALATDVESVDPLLGDAGAPPAVEPLPTQRPRGHRQRRTTLPRATRGWSRAIVWSLIGLTGFGLVYGLVARIDSSIEAGGKLRPSGGVTSVSAPFNSLVSAVLVQEGQLVRAGQPLLRLRDQAVLEQRRQLLAIRASWQKEKELLAFQIGLPATLPRDRAARLQLATGQREVQLRTQAALEERARSVINTRQQLSDLAGLRRKLEINRGITERLARLQSDGAVSRLDLDRQREREVEVATAVRRTEQEVRSGRRRERESTYKALQIPVANRKQLFAQYDNARQQLRESDSRLAELDERIALGRLRAPVAGRIFSLDVKKGEMTSPARPALQIVPQGHLEARVEVSNRDVGFVRIGMPVEVRVASFPFTDYGSIKGSVVRIGADARPADPSRPQDSFEVLVRLKADSLQRDGQVHDLRPGMAVTALLQLGPRPVISLLSDRISSFFDSSRTIR